MASSLGFVWIIKDDKEDGWMDDEAMARLAGWLLIDAHLSSPSHWVMTPFAYYEQQQQGNDDDDWPP